jgi:hypothetical protein
MCTVTDYATNSQALRDTEPGDRRSAAGSRRARAGGGRRRTDCGAVPRRSTSPQPWPAGLADVSGLKPAPVPLTGGPMALGGRCGCHGYAATAPHRPGECYWCQHARSAHSHGTGLCENAPDATVAGTRPSPEKSLHEAQIILPDTPGTPHEVVLPVGSDGGNGRERDSVTALLRDT